WVWAEPKPFRTNEFGAEPKCFRTNEFGAEPKCFRTNEFGAEPKTFRTNEFGQSPNLSEPTSLGRAKWFPKTGLGGAQFLQPVGPRLIVPKRPLSWARIAAATRLWEYDGRPELPEPGRLGVVRLLPLGHRDSSWSVGHQGDRRERRVG